MAEKIFENRQGSIDSNIFNADDLCDKAKILHKQYNSEIEKISAIAHDIKKEAQISMEKTFSLKKAQLHNELKERLEKERNDIETNNKLFWNNQNDLCINLAQSLIQTITNQEVELELLKKSYERIK